VKIKTKNAILAHNPVLHGGRFSINNPDPNLIDFSSNISPSGAPKSVKSILKKRFDQVTTYPDLNSDDLKSGLKKYVGIPKTNIIVGNGAIEIIYNFCSAFLSKKQILIPIPWIYLKIWILLYHKFQKMDVFLFVIQIILLEQYCPKNN
jgi:threonine-phosphate decarboxylase